jgi:HK97 gp10 family phage protein
MAQASFQLVGDGAVMRKLERLIAATEGQALRAAAIAGALPIMNRAKESAQNERVTSPDNTGNLARSIHIGGVQGLESPTTGTDIGGAEIRQDRVTLYVGTNAEYARRVELGFSGVDSLGRVYTQPAYPFLRPAFDTQKDEVVREMAAALRDQIRHLGGIMAATMEPETTEEQVEAVPEPVTLDLGGETRTLIVDLNTMCRVEEMTGTNMLLEFPLRTVSPNEVRLFLWACLAHEDDQLTLDQVGRWVTTENLKAVDAALMRVLAPFRPARVAADQETAADETDSES